MQSNWNWLKPFALGILISPLLFTGIASAQSGITDPPTVLNPAVRISDIEEHRLWIEAPHNFLEQTATKQNLYDWADWGCSLYYRLAVGPLYTSKPATKCIEQLNLNQLAGAGDGYYCVVRHLFACAQVSPPP